MIQTTTTVYCFLSPGFDIEDLLQEEGSMVFTDAELIKLGVPEAFLKKIDPGCIMDLMDEGTAAGYLLRGLDGKFHSMTGDLDTMPLAGYPFFLRHGLDWFGSTRVKMLSIPDSAAVMVNGVPDTRPSVRSSVRSSRVLTSRPDLEEPEDLAELVIDGVKVHSSMYRSVYS